MSRKLLATMAARRSVNNQTSTESDDETADVVRQVSLFSLRHIEKATRTVMPPINKKKGEERLRVNLFRSDLEDLHETMKKSLNRKHRSEIAVPSYSGYRTGYPDETRVDLIDLTVNEDCVSSSTHSPSRTEHISREIIASTSSSVEPCATIDVCEEPENIPHVSDCTNDEDIDAVAETETHSESYADGFEVVTEGLSPGCESDQREDIDEVIYEFSTLGLVDRNDLPDIIDESGLCAASVDIEKFRNSLANFVDVNESGELFRNTKFRCMNRKLQILEESRCRSIVLTRYITDKQYNDPLIRAIMDSDLNAYFQDLSLCLEGPQNDELCSARCACRRPVYSDFASVTPVHIAAALSTPEFLRNIIFIEMSKCNFYNILEKTEHAENVIDHYNEIITRWLRRRHRGGSLSTADFAVEANRLDNLMVLLQNNTVLTEQIDFGKNNDRVVDNIYSYDFDSFKQEESLLSRVIDFSSLKNLEEPILSFVIQNVTQEQLKHAVTVAASKGSLGDIELLSQFHPNLYNILLKPVEMDENWVHGVPGLIHLDVNYLNLPPPTSHILAQYDHHEEFTRLDDYNKRAIDQYKFTPLCSTLAFTDDQVKVALKWYKTAEREDIFMFISQVIIKKRQQLLSYILPEILSNPSHFRLPLNNQSIYEEYGLPSYVPLPLETVLTRTGNMEMFDLVIEIYTRCDNQTTEKFLEEDALRCLQSIQDMACRVTDQIRLALINCVLPFIDISSEKINDLILLHNYENSKDYVANYIYPKMKMRQAQASRRGGRAIQWKNAMMEARDIVSTWEGTVEEDEQIPMFLSNTVKSRQSLEVTPLRSIIKKKKLERGTPNLENIRYAAMKQLERAFILHAQRDSNEN